MNIIKLTKPIFWAFMVLVVQVLFNLILLLIFGPQSVTTKLLLGISGLVLCIVVTLLVNILQRRQPANALPPPGMEICVWQFGNAL